MKVYIVLVSYDGGEITDLKEVFKTPQKAEKYIKKAEKKAIYDEIFWYEEKEVL